MDALAPGGRVKDFVVGCAFGPGITVEMCMLKRVVDGVRRTGMETPPETESEGGGGSDVDEGSEGGSVRSQCEDQEAFISEALEDVELD